jgi:hypothetical protein
MDFLIIGASKSGTSSLWAIMRQHPQIWVPMPKELPFFDRPDYVQGWEQYARRNLHGAPTGATIGKATPSYMNGIPRDGAAREDFEREIPERIARQFPDIRLIAILRDPVQRALSQYAMGRNVGAESRDPDTVFGELLEPTALEQSRRSPRGLNGYIVLGEYGRILRGYLDAFDASQLLTLSTAQLGEDPEQVLASVWRFVGVDENVEIDLNTRYMVSADLKRRHRFMLGLYNPERRSVRMARRTVRALPPAIGASLRRRVWTPALRSVTSGGDRLRSSDAPPRYELSPELRERMIAHFEPDSAELEEMLGWSPLHGGWPPLEVRTRA